jgi:hypothetical protein
LSQLAQLSPSSPPSPCRSGASEWRRVSSPTAQAAGLRAMKHALPAFWRPMACCWINSGAILSAMTKPIMCCALCRHAWARASAIVHDIKDSTLTAGFRLRFGRTLLFDPTSPDSRFLIPEN